MKMQPLLQRKCACGKSSPSGEKCPECEQKLQRKPTTPAKLGEVPPIVHDVLATPGQPLDPETRAFMEPRFGHDFSKVRVHTDAKAAESAQAVNGLAYAVRNDVVFSVGQYQPHATVGKHLLAHELTHVIQQARSAESTRLGFGFPDSAEEKEATAAAKALIAGEAYRTKISSTRQVALQQPSLDATHLPPAPQIEQEIQPGDVVVRSGTFSGKNPLVTIIGEQYNHGGIALDSQHIHHVESNGYETVTKQSFFDPLNAAGGAVIRFQGPYAPIIQRRAAEIAQSRRYKRIPGNPFSTSDDLRTVNCNEFTHELFRQAIAELMAEAQHGDLPMFQQLLADYGDPKHAGLVKELISAKTVEFKTGGWTTGPAVRIAEAAGTRSVSKEVRERGEVLVAFEGNLEMRNLYPAEWAHSWNPIKIHLYSEGFYAVAVIRTYTPESFINSKYFQLVRRVKPGEK